MFEDWPGIPASRMRQHEHECTVNIRTEAFSGIPNISLANQGSPICTMHLALFASLRRTRRRRQNIARLLFIIALVK